MPEFDQNPLERLALQTGDIEDQFYLGALGVEAEIQRLGEFLEHASTDQAARRYAIRFAPARGD